MTTRIVLVRHAEAVCNVADVFAGHAGCAGLTDRGRAQLSSMADMVRTLVDPDSRPLVVSSAMRRAVETAGAVTAALGMPAAAPALCELCERHPGELEGTANARVRELDARDALPASVESRAAFLMRARRALRRLANDYTGRTVVVVTHGGIIAASFWVFGGLPGRLPFRVQPANASVTEWSCDDESDEWLLCRHNT